MGDRHKQSVVVAKRTDTVLLLLWPDLQEALGTDVGSTTLCNVRLRVVKETNGTLRLGRPRSGIIPL